MGDKLLRVAIPTEVTMRADHAVEMAMRLTHEVIEKGETFTFKCGKCDEDHEAEINSLVLAALFKANIDSFIDTLYGKDPRAVEAINNYALILRQLYQGNTANAELLQDHLVESMAEHLTEADVPLEAAAGVLTFTIEEWPNASTN